ncbi:hypothetical protein [Aurantibacillus circumpalustris]|uniref:hypothetical protein n=1 Tax=Aurantibacillus circumpalustris TaxID=3036359 RepID=UPI00295B2909|nr:hypothetical protein [Aurantibacillus circumpalustris]
MGYLCNLQPSEFKLKIGAGLDKTFGPDRDTDSNPNQRQILAFSTHSVLTMITILLRNKIIHLIQKEATKEEQFLSLAEKRMVLTANLIAKEYVNKTPAIPDGLTNYTELVCAHFWPNLINTHELLTRM